MVRHRENPILYYRIYKHNKKENEKALDIVYVPTTEEST